MTNHAAFQQITFRFMGSWDSVLSTNYSGTGYNLAIPSQFNSVAQAIALNEYRSDAMANWSTRNTKPYNQHMGGFPLQSIGASSSEAGRVRIERGILGAHADTHQFITYRPRDVNQLGTGSVQDPATLRNLTGTVDMQAYLAWLRENGYTFAGAN